MCGRVQAIVAAANAGGAGAPGGGGLDVELAASGFQREHAEALDRWVAAAARQAGGSEGEGEEDDAEAGTSSSGDNEEGLAGPDRGPAAGSRAAGRAAEEDEDGTAGSSSEREEGSSSESDAGRQPEFPSPAEELAERLRLDAGPHAAAPLGSACSSRRSSEGGAASAEAREDTGDVLTGRDAPAEGPGQQRAAGIEHVTGAGRPLADSEDPAQDEAEEADGLRARDAAERRNVQARVHNEGRARARTAASQRASRGSMKAAVKKGRRQAAGGAVF